MENQSVLSFQSKSTELLNSIYGPQMKNFRCKVSLCLSNSQFCHLKSTYYAHLSILSLTFLNASTFKLKVI